jgi:glycine hydroxymethyltransferase
MKQSLSELDPKVAGAVYAETRRQANTIELIASENFVSEAVLEAVGSVFTNKYAEGYPGNRYYGGCEFVDVVESLAIERVLKLFGAEHANVQPHSGTQANIAAYQSVLEPGDKILGMDLSHGGHLTHGHPLNFSGRFFEVASYGVDRETELIDFDVLDTVAKKERPKLIVAGASAYSRTIHFDQMAEIARRVDAYLMADIAHIAGLIAADMHPSPIPYADIVTSTTHKTLRGPRGGIILCPEKMRKAVNRSLFPGNQGGPLVHVIAAKAVCFEEAMSSEFKEYQGQVLRNAAHLARALSEKGFRIVSGGTDNHLFLVDLSSKGLTGKQAEKALEEASITVNKNMIPFDPHPPSTTSGIRVGTPAVTTRGMKEPEMQQIGEWIGTVLNSIDRPEVHREVGKEVYALTSRFPLYSERLGQDHTRVV